MKPQPLPRKVVAAVIQRERNRQPPPLCVDRSAEILAGDLPAGLNPVLHWFRCTTGEHVAHSACGRAPKAR